MFMYLPYLYKGTIKEKPQRRDNPGYRLALRQTRHVEAPADDAVYLT